MTAAAAQLPHLSSLLDELLDKPEEQRLAWLAARTDLSEALKEQLRDVLARDAAGELTLPPPPRYDEAELDELGADDDGNPLAADQTVGSYRLIRQLGRGGMGVVWLAERADGTFARQVALKLPHSSLDRRQLADRFARERDILASLAHPHIARLYDAGVTDDGRPWLAMEYVEGQALSEYCRQRNIDLRGRLRLFLQILRAIQYAHTEQVIHRDLKPGNILVTADGYVRLLDFGIAKLLDDERRAADTPLTQFGDRPLTLHYASPEQILDHPLGIGADLYSLGVIGYELLAEHSPYRPDRDTASALEEAVLHGEPWLASQAAAGKVPWARQLRGDLDTIFTKALKKAPADRYPTANAFAEDIERYLAGEPVLAQPDSVWYRTTKFVRRYRWGVAAVTGIVLALSIGLGVAVWQAREARMQMDIAMRQEAIARKEAQVANSVKDFIRGIFVANSSQRADPSKAREATARELLDIGARKIDSALADAPEAHQEMLITFAELYSQLGLPARSLEFTRRRIELLQGMKNVNVEDRVYSQLTHALMLRSVSIDNPDQRQAFEEADATAKTAIDQPALRGVVLSIASEYFADYDFFRALGDAHQALALGHGSDEFAAISIAAAKADLGAGDFARAKAEAEAGIAEGMAYNARAGEGNGSFMQLPVLYECLARAEDALGDMAGAEAHLRQAMQGISKVFGEGDREVLSIQARLALFLLSHGKAAEGNALLAQTTRLLAKPSTGSSRHAFSALAVTGAAQAEAGRFREALATLTKALAMRASTIDASPSIAEVLRVQSRALIGLGRRAEAAQVLARAVAMREKAGIQAPAMLREEAMLRARLLTADNRHHQATARLASR